ncbi:hypothetical protein BH11BAC2_BH11BAC2_17170 [soil metagenome]
MNNQFEPHKTGNPELDSLLKSVKNDPLVFQLADAEKLIQGAAAVKKPSGNNQLYLKILAGVAVISMGIYFYLNSQSKSVVENIPVSNSNLTEQSIPVTTVVPSEKNNPAPANKNISEKAIAPATDQVKETEKVNLAVKKENLKTTERSVLGGSATVYLEYKGLPATVIVSHSGVQQLLINNQPISSDSYSHYSNLIQQAYEKSGIHPDKNASEEANSPAMALTQELRNMKLLNGDDSFEFILYGDSAVMNSIALAPAEFLRLKKVYETSSGKALHPKAKIRLKH